MSPSTQTRLARLVLVGALAFATGCAVQPSVGSGVTVEPPQPASVIPSAPPATLPLPSGPSTAVRPPADPTAVLAGSGPIIVLSPHQDDEVLSMGPAVLQAVRTGRPVFAYLITGGRGSSAFGVINKRLAHEGRRQLTLDEFAAARNASFVEAMVAFGVQQDRIVLWPETGPADLQMVDRASGGYSQYTTFLDWLVAHYPGSTLLTMSWLDWHREHYRLGYAADAECVEGKATCLFAQSALYRVDPPAPIAMPERRVVTPPMTCLTTDSPRLQQAIHAYTLWQPQTGHYASGQISVPEQFDYLQHVALSCVHGPSTAWGSEADKAKAQQWVATIQQPDLTP